MTEPPLSLAGRSPDPGRADVQAPAGAERSAAQRPASIPLVDLAAQHRDLREAILSAFARVIDSGRFVLGPEVEALERELAAILDVGHAIGVSSGTDAILATLMALDVGPGDEVITPAFSFFATAGCVARLGARPVFADIDPATFNVDPAAVEAALTPKTRAIIVVHLYGLSADLDPIVEVGRSRGVTIIEDACQAIGARYRGRTVGGIGELGCFSFYPTKNLGALGDAGLVTTNDDALAARVRLVREHGGERQYEHEMVGGNFRIDALQAAALGVKVPYLAGWTSRRRQHAARYAALFAEAGLDTRVRLPVEPADCRHVYHQYAIRTPDRDGLRARLADRGIGTGVYYPSTLHLQPCFASLGLADGAYPEAEAAARETLALPVYPELTEAQQAAVVRCIAECLRA